MSETSEDFFGDDVTAGEFALGVTDAAERRAAQARIVAEPAFAALVDFWIERLAPLADAIPAVSPPAALKRKISASLFGARPAKHGLWSSLSFLRTAFVGTAVVAVASLTALFLINARSLAPRFIYVATLTAADTPALATVRVNPENGVVELSNAAIETAMEQADRAAELWLIPADGVPKSLGLIEPEGRSKAIVPTVLRSLIEAGGVLAISIEPLGGSPTGAPTGPVVAVGPLLRF